MNHDAPQTAIVTFSEPHAPWRTLFDGILPAQTGEAMAAFPQPFPGAKQRLGPPLLPNLLAWNPEVLDGPGEWVSSVYGGFYDMYDLATRAGRCRAGMQLRAPLSDGYGDLQPTGT